jgi:hypothetical protein
MALSTTLENRIDRLAGCQGHWVLIRDSEPETYCSHQWHQDPSQHLATCLAARWHGLSLGFVPSYCGYSDYSDTGLVGLANYNVLIDPASTPDPHNAVLEVGYGWNGRGIVLDLRFITDDILETIEALESYPLISDDEHSQLEWNGIAALWNDEPIRDRVRMLQDLGQCIFAARRDSTPWDIDELRESLLSQLNEYPTIAA